jgi:hypothetical protein
MAWSSHRQGRINKGHGSLNSGDGSAMHRRPVVEKARAVGAKKKAPAAMPSGALKYRMPEASSARADVHLIASHPQSVRFWQRCHQAAVLLAAGGQ